MLPSEVSISMQVVSPEWLGSETGMEPWTPQKVMRRLVIECPARPVFPSLMSGDSVREEIGIQKSEFRIRKGSGR